MSKHKRACDRAAASSSGFRDSISPGYCSSETTNTRTQTQRGMNAKKPKVEVDDRITEEDNGEINSRDEQEEALVALIEHRTKEVEHIRRRIAYYQSQVSFFFFFPHSSLSIPSPFPTIPLNWCRTFLSLMSVLLLEILSFFCCFSNFTCVFLDVLFCIYVQIDLV